MGQVLGYIVLFEYNSNSNKQLPTHAFLVFLILLLPYN